jgi:LemA protein
LRQSFSNANVRRRKAARLEAFMLIGWIILGIIVVVVGYLIVAYNNLVRQKQLTQEGWSGIDVQLKRRADLIPNLMESVKGYMAHERDTLEAVTKARTDAMAVQNGTPEQRAQAEGALSQALGRLFAVAEAYPDLKASQNFLQFQAALQQTEDEIQLSRRYYNGTARDMNTAVQSFPSNIIANFFHFAAVQYFEIDNAADRAVPQVKFS